MNVFNLKLYGDECELLSFSAEGGYLSELRFGEAIDGFLTLGGITVRVRDGIATVDQRLVGEGEDIPTLILKNRRITLPPVIKRGADLFPAAPTPEYIRAISLRERELSLRVDQLSELCGKLYDKVYGTTIF